MILDINSRIARPWSSVNPVTAPSLSRRSEKIVTNFGQIVKAHIPWIPLYSLEEVINSTSHDDIINDTIVKPFGYSLSLGKTFQSPGISRMTSEGKNEETE
jgi:hypothetical protein